jgi:tRNA(Ile)-lysidine synthase
MTDVQGLVATLRRLAGRPTGRLHCCIAFSGGLDSTVLLHLLAQARARLPGALALRALHVDHGLQPAARDFCRQARRIARSERVRFAVLEARVAIGRGRSVEESAREARYAVLQAALEPGELLLTAQHADDQLETVLLALMRGAGPAGLAGMAAVTPFGAGQLVRPLLGQTRGGLQSIATTAGLSWIEDPTNQSLRFNRNYLRSEVLPALRARWPAGALTAARSARHCAEAAMLEGLQARRDLDTAQDGQALEAAVLRRWPAARQRAVLRAWCAQRSVRVPDERRLGEALKMLETREDAAPLLEWPGARLRLYRGRLLLSGTAGTAALAEAGGRPGVPLPWVWGRRRRLRIEGVGMLELRNDALGDVDMARLPATLWLRWPGSGEAREAGQSGRRLRKLLQALDVPAWERDQLPLLCDARDGAGTARTLAIADLWLAPQLQARADARRRGRFVWRPVA